MSGEPTACGVLCGNTRTSYGVLGGETGTNSDELVIAITLGVGSQTTP